MREIEKAKRREKKTRERKNNRGIEKWRKSVGKKGSGNKQTCPYLPNPSTRAGYDTG